MSPLGQELERAIHERDLEKNKSAFTEQSIIEDWLERLDQDPAPDALERFRALVRKHFPGLLENPAKKKGKKQGFAFSDRQRKIAERLHSISGR